MFEIYKDIKEMIKVYLTVMILAAIILPFWSAFLELILGRK